MQTLALNGFDLSPYLRTAYFNVLGLSNFHIVHTLFYISHFFDLADAPVGFCKLACACLCNEQAQAQDERGFEQNRRKTFIWLHQSKQQQ